MARGSAALHDVQMVEFAAEEKVPAEQALQEMGSAAAVANACCGPMPA